MRRVEILLDRVAARLHAGFGIPDKVPDPVQLRLQLERVSSALPEGRETLRPAFALAP